MNNNNQQPQQLKPEQEQEIIIQSLKNGLYHVALRQLEKQEKSLILRTVNKHPNEKWVKQWLVKKLLAGQKATDNYRIVITDILEAKYEVI